MMNYEEFKTQLAEMVMEDYKKEAGKEITPRFLVVEKVNVTYDSLSIPVTESLGINICLNDYYEKYKEGATLETIARRIVDIVLREISNIPNFDEAELRNYNAVKNKLVIEVISQKGNEALLENLPHKDFLDLAIIYRIIVDENPRGRGSLIVSNSLMNEYEITAEQLHEDALENAITFKPLEIFNILAKLQEMYDIPDDELENMETDFPMYTATVPGAIGGACVIAYPDFFEKAAEKCGGSFYLIPSSRHEVIFIPDEGNLDCAFYKSMIKEVNTFEVDPDDKLSDNLYHYDCQAKAFEIVEDYVARVQA